MTRLLDSLYSALPMFSRKKNGADSVAMFHTGRCGSTVLGQMLDQHSMIKWAGEIFEEYTQDANSGAMSTALVERTINSNRGKNDSGIFGFETKYLPKQHLSDKCINMELANYIELLRRIHFGKFIILDRKNYLRRFISARVGVQTSSWHSKKEAQAPTKVSLNVRSFGITQQPILESFETLDRMLMDVRRALEQYDTLLLNYEDDILIDPKIGYRKVCDFLQLADEDPKIKYARTNPFKCKEIINNYDEVEKILKNTRYSWMLDN